MRLCLIRKSRLPWCSIGRMTLPMVAISSDILVGAKTGCTRWAQSWREWIRHLGYIIPGCQGAQLLSWCQLASSPCSLAFKQRCSWPLSYSIDCKNYIPKVSLNCFHGYIWLFLSLPKHRVNTIKPLNYNSSHQVIPAFNGKG